MFSAFWHEIVLIQLESGKKKKKKANSSFAPDICSHEPTFVKTDINSSWSPVIDNNFIKKVPYHSHFQANTAAALFTDCLKAVLDPVSLICSSHKKTQSALIGQL